MPRSRRVRPARMRPEETSALGEVGGEAVAGLAGHVRDLHEGIAERVWRSVGPTATPVRAVHDRVATAVYGAVGRSLLAGARAGARAASVRTPPGSPSVERSPVGRLA